MSEAYAREILKRNVAQICQIIGWNGINTTSLDILVHILERYMQTLCVQVNRYAEQSNRTEPSLRDLGLVFRDLHVQLPELLEYTRCVPALPPPVNVESFPKPKESNLNFLKPGSHEVVTRPMHVHEHLPPMYPEKERDTPAVADTIEIRQNGVDIAGSSTNDGPETNTDVTDKQKDIFKRPIDPVPNSKRPRLRLEEEERTREISSVMMTMSGFLSPAREGKLPEARPPTIISDKHYDRHKANHSNLMRVPIAHTALEKSDKKSKKSKTPNGKVMKSKKKDKSHKGESSKSKDSSKLDKHLPGHPLKNRDVHPTHHNHITMPAPKPILPSPKPMLPPPPPVVDNVRPVIKQEPVDPPVIIKNALPGEESIPVPRRIPISKSPLVSNAHSNPKHSIQSSTMVPDLEIKQEKIEVDEKLTSQPDRSKVNIFKRISNKSKDDKITQEVVPEKSQSDSLISRLQPQDGLRIDNRNHVANYGKVVKEDSFVNNNNDRAVDLSKPVDLTSNEVINIDDDYDQNDIQFRKDHPEPRPIPVPVNKNVHLPNPKDVPGVSPKIKKEKKHREKKDKSLEKAAKLLKKQQLAMSISQHMDFAQNISNYKMPNSKPPKMSRPKNESKMPHFPAGFPIFPPPTGLMPGPGLIPNPGLIPTGFLADAIANNPALRGLPATNLMANPFALGSSRPGLIPSPSFLPEGMVGGMMSMQGNFGHSSKSQSRNIPQMLRRPSLEVIPVDNDEDRRSNYHKSPMIPIREKDRHSKQKIPTVPNILQKHRSKSHKESHQKSHMLKMPIVQPDITIHLNPPRAEPVPEPVHEPVVTVSPIPAEVPVKPPDPEPIAISEPTTIAEVSKEKDDKSEKKKDKSHKKEKKDKDGLKVKKKKDKKDKNKDKSDKKKDKEDKEKQELKDRIKKEKKEKRKEKPTDVLVPKLTLKLGSASPMPPSSPDVFKLNIKPVVKREEETIDDSLKEEPVSRENSCSPELAQISALVTRPPKQKHSSKQNHVSEQIDTKSPPESSSSPTRKNRPPSSHSKYKRILFKPISKKSHMEQFDDSDISMAEEPPPKPEVQPIGPLPTPYYLDDQGNKIWVCPACGKPDNGSPMIGCDGCDGWYHWACVGIKEEPGASEDWFCKPCMAKRAAMVFAGVTAGRKRGRKPKLEKVKDCH